MHSKPASGLWRAYTAEWWIFAATALSLLTLLFFPSTFRGRTEGYLHPHGFCYIWDPALVGSHVVADLMIGTAYVAISVTLGYLVYRLRHLLPFHWMFLAFGLFILTCGATHFMDVWTLWRADFWASAGLKIVTGVASVATAIALPPLIPQVVRLVHDANLVQRRTAELREAERQREHAEAQNQAKDLFLATLSHELRTPLNAMAGWLQVLVTTAEQGNPTARKALEALQRNISLQTRLVEDMLDVSSILTGRLPLQKTRLDLRRVVQQAADNARRQAAGSGIAVGLELPEEAVSVDGDEARLQQVLSNLLSNALKFSEAGGSVGVRLVRDDATAVLSVFDTGCGIAPDFLPKVFDPFAQADQSPTRRTGGLGLGLAIVRHLVERHGGTVSASSDGAGRGATFTVRVPLTPPEG